MLSSRMSWLAWSTAVLLTAAGCASGDEGPAGDGGASGEGGTADAGELDSGGGGVDAGDPLDCPDGQHLCGGGCIDDQPNEPERGCRLGCGEPCPTSEFEVASCTDEGECTFECEPPSVREGDECVCERDTCEDLGAMCGTLDDGCGGTLECGTCEDGTECVDGTCGCPDDAGEPNENRLRTHGLPAFSDAPDTSMTFDAFTISSDTDEDWYEFTVSDDLDFANPDVRVQRSGIPAGSDYDLGLWYVCNEGGDDGDCSSGATDNMIGRGCVSRASGTTTEEVELHVSCSSDDESGVAYVRVTSSTWGGSCAPYTLGVRVE